MQQFGQKLRRLRLHHGLTLKDLALALGHAAHGHISELESGKKMPTAEFVLRAARFFDVTIDLLMKDELELNTSNPYKPVEGGALMSLAFADRPPTRHELEKLRLVLSTYQDGTGMLAQKDSTTLPGWRDFERAVALVFGGEAQESKAIFDVLVPIPSSSVSFGLSCKMRRELNRIDKDGRVTIELSNSAGKFWQHLEQDDINQSNYRDRPLDVGNKLVELVESWHTQVSSAVGGNVEISKSSYLVLSWNKAGWYQLHQFHLDLPNPRSLNWYFPTKREKGAEAPAKRIKADDDTGTVFEWFGESGGQLKYYPLAEKAIWSSERFQLESLGNMEYGVLIKAAAYFPQKWADACRESLDGDILHD